MQKTIDFVEFAAMINVAHLTTMILIVIYMGGARNFPKGEADPSNLGAQIRFSRNYECQNLRKNVFPTSDEGL